MWRRSHSLLSLAVVLVLVLVLVSLVVNYSLKVVQLLSLLLVVNYVVDLMMCVILVMCMISPVYSSYFGGSPFRVAAKIGSIKNIKLLYSLVNR